MNVVETKEVTKRFGGLVAVNQVSMHVEEGEIVELIGPNGAGKTTFLNAIAGLDPPTIGKRFDCFDIRQHAWIYHRQGRLRSSFHRVESPQPDVEYIYAG